MTGLYIHVPFCLSKCPYCDFYSVAYSKETAVEYAAAVIRNLRRYSGERFDTVYFGGGTPILLWQYIGEILAAADVDSGAEITVEANPCMATNEALHGLKSSGVNRLSFGVQSLDDGELTRLGRRHRADTAIKAIERSYNAGFVNVSADVMLATPAQTLQSLSHTLDVLTALPLTHISSYLLKIEKNTPFGRDNVKPADDELCDEMYLFMAERLEQSGFMQYEISNFAKDGFESRHNLKYWTLSDYLGIGCAAHSFYNGARFRATDDVRGFIYNEQQTTEITDENVGGADEYIMLGLRLTEGISLARLDEYGVKNEVLSRLPLIPTQYINADEKRIALTKSGFLLSNQIIGKLLGY